MEEETSQVSHEFGGDVVLFVERTGRRGRNLFATRLSNFLRKRRRTDQGVVEVVEVSQHASAFSPVNDVDAARSVEAKA